MKRSVPVEQNRIKGKDDKIFDIVNGIILGVIFLIVLYPFWFVIIASISDPTAVSGGEVILFPKGFTVAGYKRVFENEDIWTGYGNTILYTVCGTILNVIVTVMCGYALSRRELKGRNFLMIIFMIPMYFSGGMIPAYLNIRSFGLTDTKFIMIILGLISTYNLIVCRTFFMNSIPWELHEAAFIDGCSDFRAFFSVVLPLAKPIIAVLMIYYAVGHWNNYFSAMIYLKDSSKYPLQLFLRQILIKSELSSMMVDSSPDSAVSMIMEQNIANQLKFAVIMVSTLPILLVYPWLEKFFAKGVMIGSIKG